VNGVAIGGFMVKWASKKLAERVIVYVKWYLGYGIGELVHGS
jgi:hypothetical protein